METYNVNCNCGAVEDYLDQPMQLLYLHIEQLSSGVSSPNGRGVPS